MCADINAKRKTERPLTDADRANLTGLSPAELVESPRNQNTTRERIAQNMYQTLLVDLMPNDTRCLQLKSRIKSV